MYYLITVEQGGQSWELIEYASLSIGAHVQFDGVHRNREDCRIEPVVKADPNIAATLIWNVCPVHQQQVPVYADQSGEEVPLERIWMVAERDYKRVTEKIMFGNSPDTVRGLYRYEDVMAKMGPSPLAQAQCAAQSALSEGLLALSAAARL